MAFEIPGFKFTLEAGADLSAAQHFFMALAADGQVDPSGDGLQVVGVLQNNPEAAGRGAELMSSGISKVVAGEAIAVNDPIASDAAGKAKTAVMGDIVVGLALDAVGADLEVCSVLLNIPGGRIIP